MTSPDYLLRENLDEWIWRSKIGEPRPSETLSEYHDRIGFDHRDWYGSEVDKLTVAFLRLGKEFPDPVELRINAFRRIC